jgi:hypothetical protein
VSASPVPAEEAEPDLDTTTTTPEREEGGSEGTGERWGGLTPREAALRGVAARRAKQAREEGTTSQKITRAFDGLTQTDWDRAVRGALGSASGMQALTRLLDRVQGTQQEEAGEDVTLTPDERARILAAFASRGGGDATSAASPSTTLHVEDAGGEE